MILRNFIENDKQEFLSMCDDFYNSGASLHPIELRQMEKTFNEIVNNNPYVKGFIFEQDGKCAGYSLVWVFWSNEAGGFVGFLDEIFVKSEFRGQSIGSEFLNQVADALPNDIVLLRLEVCESNKGAIKLYQKHGFEFLDYKQMIKQL